MKWFQVDSDTPNDPKIRALVRDLGPAGMGGLFFIWCHIADHGIRKPGWSIDSLGRPMSESELLDASKLNESEFLKLASICTSTGHWLKRPWETRKVIAIPAMARRADTYTKRRVRTHVEPTSKDVPRDFDNKTREDSTSEEPTERTEKAAAKTPRPSASRSEPPTENFRIITKIAHEAIDIEGIDADLGQLADAVKSLCAIRSITYNSDVVRKAVDSALAQRRKAS